MNWDEWQVALADEFRAVRDQPVFIYVDDDVLATIAGDTAAADLSLVVRSELATSGDPYKPILRRSLRDSRQSTNEPPSTLPLLALTVLAATRMERTSGVSSNAYYKRLWEATGVDDEDRLAQRMQVHFDTVAALWRHFDKWLNAGGRDFGESTIRLVDQHRTLIGYPLSQALMRKTDRNVLTRLWSILGREVAAELSGDELLTHVERWIRTDRGLSRQFLDTVDQLTDKTRSDFSDAIEQAAHRWGWHHTHKDRQAYARSKVNGPTCLDRPMDSGVDSRRRR